MVTLQAQGQSERGYFYITKLCLLAIKDWAFNTTNLSFQSDFLYYLGLTGRSTPESLSHYLSQVEASRVVKAITPWTSTHYLPPISDYTSQAILTDLAPLLEERLCSESGDHASKLFGLFCKYLERLWDKCPRDVPKLLLNHSTRDDIVWSSVIDFLQAIKRNESPISLPSQRRMEFLRLVLESGANLNTKRRQPKHNDPFKERYDNKARRSIGVLHAAVQLHNPQPIIELFLQHKTDINALDENGRTPLDYAVVRYTQSLEVQYSTRNEVKRKEIYLSRLAVAQFLLSRGARMSEEFRVTCNWHVSADVAEIVRDLDIPTDDRLPYPWIMAERGLTSTGGRSDSIPDAHLENYDSARDVPQASQISWLAYGAQQAYGAVSWLLNVRGNEI